MGHLAHPSLHTNTQMQPAPQGKAIRHLSKRQLGSLANTAHPSSMGTGRSCAWVKVAAALRLIYCQVTVRRAALPLPQRLLLTCHKTPSLLLQSCQCKFLRNVGTTLSGAIRVVYVLSGMIEIRRTQLY
jgi:hypothetical protein